MSSFKDPDGQEWKLRLTVGLVGAVKRETQVDIGSITRTDAAWVQFLFSDGEKLVGVLWVLCESQAKERGLTPEAFAFLFDGPTLDQAGNALAGAIADFFPRSRVAAALRESLRKVLTATDEKAVAELEAAAATYCKPATNLLESAESTPPG